jgi:hypothetical protein
VAFPEGDKRRYGYSRDKRFDCVQVLIALVVTPEGFPLGYEVLAGNTMDNQTLRSAVEGIEKQYGKARRVWVMDKGVPTEETLTYMRSSEPPAIYLVGTPKGRLSKLESQLAERPWHEAEEAFKNLKGDLALRPVYHQKEQRIEAHIFVAFLAYCLQVTLGQWLHSLSPGLTPRSVLEKFAAVQMVDVHLPTTDSRHVILPRYTQPEKELQVLLHQLNLRLPEQPPPRITAAGGGPAVTAL